MSKKKRTNTATATNYQPSKFEKKKDSILVITAINIDGNGKYDSEKGIRVYGNRTIAFNKELKSFFDNQLYLKREEFRTTLNEGEYKHKIKDGFIVFNIKTLDRTSRKRPPAPKLFIKFWEAFGNKKNIQNARVYWNKLSKPEQEQLVEAAESYRIYLAKKKGKVKHEYPATWIKKELWKEYI